MLFAVARVLFFIKCASLAVYHRAVKLTSTPLLPAGWRLGQDRTGRLFFVNDIERRTQWDDPRPLPQGWKMARVPAGAARAGAIYFVHHDSKSTTW